MRIKIDGVHEADIRDDGNVSIFNVSPVVPYLCITLSFEAISKLYAAQQSAQADAFSRESCPECFGYGGFHSDNCSHIAARR